MRDVGIDSDSRLADELIERGLRLRRGQTLELSRLRLAIERLFGRGDFEHLLFELRPVGRDGACDVVIHAQRKSWGPTYIRAGLALESNLQGSSGFGLALQANRREINSLGAEWRTTGLVGETSTLSTEFFQPLSTANTWFVSAAGEASAFDVSVFDQQIGAATYDVRTATASGTVGRLLGTWGLVGLSYVRLTGDVDVEVGGPGAVGFDFEDGYLGANLTVDTLDDAVYPRNGVLLGVNYALGQRGLGADLDYQLIRGAAAVAGSLERTTFVGYGRVQAALSGETPVYRTDTIGGFLQLSGLQRGALSGPNSGVVGAIVRHRMAGANTRSFGFPVYVGASVEAGNTWEERADLFDGLRIGGSLFFSVGTPIGPVYFAYGRAEGGEDGVYLFVGQIF